MGTVWAMQTGINYPNATVRAYYTYTNLTNESSFGDFQYVLHAKIGKGGGEGWQCPLPCHSTYIVTPAPTMAPTPAPKALPTPMPTTTFTTTTTTTLASGSSSGFEWWAWLLIIGGLLLCCGAIA